MYSVKRGGAPLTFELFVEMRVNDDLITLTCLVYDAIILMSLS
jgi:hypothetical protein